MSEVTVMLDGLGFDEKTSYAELIALSRKTQEEIEAHGDVNELNLLVRDFAKEQLKQRLLIRVEFVRMMELSRPE
jgi:hypothetical protein